MARQHLETGQEFREQVAVVSGKRPFDGDTHPDVIAAIVRREPTWPARFLGQLGRRTFNLYWVPTDGSFAPERLLEKMGPNPFRQELSPPYGNVFQSDRFRSPRGK